MLLIVLNDKQPSGIKTHVAEERAHKTLPVRGAIRVTRVQADGAYVVIFDDDLRGYAFGTWLSEHNVKNQTIAVKDNKALGAKLVELLPQLAEELAAEAGGSVNRRTQLMREQTIQMLVEAINKRHDSPFMAFK